MFCMADCKKNRLRNLPQKEVSIEYLIKWVEFELRIANPSNPFLLFSAVKKVTKNPSKHINKLLEFAHYRTPPGCGMIAAKNIAEEEYLIAFLFILVIILVIHLKLPPEICAQHTKINDKF